MSLICVDKVGVVDGLTVVKVKEVDKEEDNNLYVLAPITSVTFGKKCYGVPSVEVVNLAKNEESN